MIGFFTDPYENELLYSSIARYLYYIGYTNLKGVQKDLFLKNSLIPTLALGSHLEILSQRLGKGYTSESLIWNNTIYPYYHNFLPKNRQLKIQESTKYDGGSKMYLLLGSIAGAVCKKDSIYYCSECVENDREEVGECYIHREHQLEGVLVCPHHERPLSRYCRDKRNTSRVEYIRLDSRLLREEDEMQIDEELVPQLIQLSKMAYELIGIGEKNCCRDILHQKYREILGHKGLLTANGQIRQRELYDEFKLFYNPKILQLLESELDGDDEYNWLKVITRNSSRVVHPIRHLLLINFLGIDIRELLQCKVNNYQPFGKGPWPCLNKAATHYLEDVIENIQITADYKMRGPVGTFRCNCGFVYSRKGPDKRECDRYRIGRKKVFGQVWENKLRRYLQKESISLREMAREMDCDPKTILKYDRIFKTYRYTIRDREVIEVKEITTTMKEEICQKTRENQYEKELREMVKKHSKLSRTEIREQMQKQYIALYRRDKQLLGQILPRPQISKGGKERVNWKARDDMVLKQVKEVYEVLQQRSPLIRITLGNLAKPVGLENKLLKWLDKLPTTKAFLGEVLESIEEFQIKRCKAIIEEAEQNNQDIKLSEIQRRTGLRTNRFHEIIKSLDIDMFEEMLGYKKKI